MASIVDRPKQHSQDDLLEIEKYTDGLIKFIKTSSTPMTIGVQGEWGSGKTSLLNTVKENLCNESNGNYYGIWINTWEYSLLSSPDETLIKIISGLVTQISAINRDKSSKALSKLASLTKSFGTRTGGIGGAMVGMAGDLMETAEDNSIKGLRDSLQAIINETTLTNKKQFIFFIDDLDRLDPAVAVNILELIKNLFDLENCIFVLAIDYGVVVKGLQSKFGKMTEENEWEFRAFFDKIIQLPFSMPISSYNISKYLQSLLVDVNYFAKEELDNEEVLEKISEIVNLSVGTNPRALKRLANSVSLIEIIRAEQKITSQERVVEFALICIQIAYPLIYGLIQKESDFTNWNDRFVLNVLKNKKIDESDLEMLKESEEFDEEWEQNLWRVAQVNNFLKQRTYQLSKLLNFIKEETPTSEEESMGDTLDRLLSMSSVTSVSADSSTSGSIKKERPRYSSFDDYILTKPNLPEEIKLATKKLLNAIIETLGKEAEITYAPSAINIKMPNENGKQRAISYIRPQKKEVAFSIMDKEKKLHINHSYVTLDKRYSAFRMKLNKENNFNFEKYIILFEELYGSSRS